MAATVPVQESSAPTTAALRVAGLGVDVLGPHGWMPVVENAGFSVSRGQTLGIVGESGSGKTVTSLAIMRLLDPRTTRIRADRLSLGETDLTGLTRRQLDRVRGSRISMVFQEPMTSLDPSYTVGEQVAAPLRRHLGLGRKEALKRAARMLDLVGIAKAEQRLGAYPHEFSGGMRQRVMIAGALVCEPEVLIADEPTTALDVTIQAQILDLLRSMRDEFGLALVIITHNMGVVADICDHVAVMYAGQVVERSAVDQLFAEPAHPYTAKLMRSTPRLDDATVTPEFVPGSQPDMAHLPPGCRFHPRCTHAVAGRCDVEPIELVTLESGVHTPRRVRCVRHGELELRSNR